MQPVGLGGGQAKCPAQSGVCPASGFTWPLGAVKKQPVHVYLRVWVGGKGCGARGGRTAGRQVLVTKGWTGQKDAHEYLWHVWE